MKRASRGFTLLELLITVVIIGLLAAFAIPLYQDYVGRAQMARVLAELSPYRLVVERAFATGVPVPAAAGMGYVASSITTPMLVSFLPDGSGSLSVVLDAGSSSLIRGATLFLRRDALGVWVCEVTTRPVGWKDDFLPGECVAP